MVMMPEEVILAIALVDLPINIDDREGIKVFKDRGQSWAFLTCDCDDHMVHVVEEILSICSFQQLQELCFWKENGLEQTVLDRATPKCREAMNQALRFLGRFEFLGEGPLFSDMQTGFKAFDALDFGGNEEGKPDVVKTAFLETFDYGKSADGYWTYDRMVLQLEDCHDVLDALYSQQATGSPEQRHMTVVPNTRDEFVRMYDCNCIFKAVLCLSIIGQK